MVNAKRQPQKLSRALSVSDLSAVAVSKTSAVSEASAVSDAPIAAYHPPLKLKPAENREQRFREFLAKALFFASALFAAAAVLLICVFIFGSAWPAFRKIGLVNFITGKIWDPESDVYGLLPMIAGSACVTGVSLLFALPVGILTALYSACFCPPRFKSLLVDAVNLLAGIPSVVYGFFGLMAIVPVIRWFAGGSGLSLLAASIVLAMMILPTIISVSVSALEAVPQAYMENSLALGVSREISAFKAVLPAARSGITAALILGVGRAIGETTAVVMVEGNQAILPTSLTGGLRTLTADIAIELGYSADLHREALIAAGAVLFAIILIINGIFALSERAMAGQSR